MYLDVKVYAIRLSEAWISWPPVTATRLWSTLSGMWGRGRENNMRLQGFRG
jgi:hypothetical protein